MEDLLSNLKIGCDESGYDSDSTRAGADSPDSGKSVQPMSSLRKFSTTSEDYQGVDLALTTSLKKLEPSESSAPSESPEPLESSEPSESLDPPDSFASSLSKADTLLITDDTILEDDVSLVIENALDSTAATLILSDDDSFDFDDNTFTNGTDCPFTGPSSKNYNADSLKETKVSPEKIFDAEILSESNLNPVCRTPEKDLPTKQALPSRVSNLRDSEKHLKTPKGCKVRRSLCHMNLLDNAASPCRDSPPVLKFPLSVKVDPIQYFSPKRSRSDMEPEVPENVLPRRKVKKAVPQNSPPKMLPLTSTTKTLVRRELKTMKLIVESQGNLGISVERKEAVRPFYIISKLDPNGDAEKSNQFRIGDEIVRVCGRRIRGMSEVEARNALRSCFGAVELQIAREPTFAFGGEFGETWGENIITRAKSDFEIWSFNSAAEEICQENSTLASGLSKRSFDTSCNTRESSFLKEDAAPKKEEMNKKIVVDDEETSCQIVGAITKDGKSVSLGAMNEIENVDFQDTENQSRKITGMKKFHVVRKRNSNATPYSRRATSLPMDLMTIYFEKGSMKKLGFTIVGGSDSNKGSMGIFVKDIIPGGQAAEQGTLRVGDEIRAINGIPMEGLTHAKALQTFKAAKTGTMILHVGRRDPTNKRLAR